MSDANDFLGAFLGKAVSATIPATSTLSRFLPLALVAALVVFPFAAGDYAVNFMITILFTAYLAQCWNIMSGYAGQFSFGHAAFFGIGAYVSTLLYVDYGLTPWIGMFAGAASAAAVGALIGFLSFRYKLKGDYFALATLAFAEMLRVFVNNMAFTHGSVGVTILYKDQWTEYLFSDKRAYYFIMLVMVAALTFMVSRLTRTKTGLYFVAIRENEDAANALGVNPFRTKLAALMLSSALTALLGTFYAQYYLYIDPSIAFGIHVSQNSIMPCIIGGVGTVFGPVLGAFVMVPLSEITNVLFAGSKGLNMLIYGIILIAVIMYLPNGLLGLREPLARLVRRRSCE